jgi:hypothetical protein
MVSPTAPSSSALPRAVSRMLGVLRISNQRPLGDHRRPFQVGGNQRRAGREAAARRVPDQLLRVINGISGQTAISDGDPLQIGGRDHLPGLQPAIEHRHLDLLSQPPGHGEALQRRAAGDGCQHGGEAPTRRLVGETLDREFGIGRDGAPRGDARELQRSPATSTPRSVSAARTVFSIAASASILAAGRENSAGAAGMPPASTASACADGIPAPARKHRIARGRTRCSYRTLLIVASISSAAWITLSRRRAAPRSG